MSTEQHLNKSLEILKAYKEGKEIWRNCLNSSSTFSDYPIDNIEVILEWLKKEPDTLYIEEEPKLRAYKSAHEFLTELKLHGPYILDGSTYRILKKFTIMSNNELVYSFSGWDKTSIKTWDEIHDKITWADGTQFGILEYETEKET